ncbi:MAG: DUF2207 domain-containing protein, partial [Acidimicrobiales bacterium]
MPVSPPISASRFSRGAARVLAVAAAGLALSAGVAPAAAQAGERITSYAVALEIEASGALVVTERIAYDFGSAQRRGIFRDIPVRLRYDNRHDRLYPLAVLSVDASPGTPDQFVVLREGSIARVRIGDPDRTISGAHSYTIRYRVERALNGFDDHDELYWNAVGAQWAVPIGRATAEVGAPAAVTQVACLSGPAGSTLPCSESSHSGATAAFAHDRLDPYEALTVVVGIPKGVVPEPVPLLEERWSLAQAFSVTPFTVVAGLGLSGLAVAGFSRLAWRTGRDRRARGSPVDVAFAGEGAPSHRVPMFERPQTPVEFAPPDGMRPGQVGTLVDEVANPLDATATLVDLAVRGYLRIEEIPKKGWFATPDWSLTRLRGPDGLRPYESLLHASLFRGRSDREVKLSELRNTFAARLARVQDALYDDVVRQGWF